jgi:hypothetical protein
VRPCQTRWHCGLQAACRHGQVFAFTDECQLVLFTVPIDANQVAKVDLFGSQQIRQRIYDVPFDGPL